MCQRTAGELHYSHAAGGVCCVRCHCRAAPPVSLSALAYRPPPPPPRPKPTRYARLVERVWGALERAGHEVHGGTYNVFGGGDPKLPLMGWCPVCHQGTVAVFVLHTDPPKIRLNEGCTGGCTPDEVARALR